MAVVVVAAYAVLGVIAGYFGANIQAFLQMPAVLLPFAGVFLLLATASFGWLRLQVPARWQARAGNIGRQRSGAVGASLMGFFAALAAWGRLGLFYGTYIAARRADHTAAGTSGTPGRRRHSGGCHRL